MLLIQNTVSRKKEVKHCKSSKWFEKVVRDAKADDVECEVQNSRLMGVCGLILGDLFRFKKEKLAFIGDKTSEGRYNTYGLRQQKVIHQYIETKIEHLQTMHEYIQCDEVKDHMLKYYPQLFLVHAYTLSDMSIKENILPFVDFGLNKVVKDEENLDEDEQDDMDMYVNVPSNIRNRMTEIFLSIEGTYAQNVRYRRDTSNQESQDALTKMYELMKHISNVKNEMIGAKQEMEDTINQAEEKISVSKNEIVQRIIGKLDAKLRDQKYDTEELLRDMNIPKYGNQTALIVIVSIQMVIILVLLFVIRNKNENENMNSSMQ